MALVLSLALSAFAAPPPKPKLVHWMDYTEALNKAKHAHKLIFVDLYADWCVPCRIMDANTYSDPTVASLLNTRFFPVKLDREKARIQKRGDRRIRISIRIHNAARHAPVRIEVHKDKFVRMFSLIQGFGIIHPMHELRLRRRGRKGRQSKAQDKSHPYKRLHHFLPFFGSILMTFGIPSKESILSETASSNGIQRFSSSRILLTSLMKLSRV